MISQKNDISGNNHWWCEIKISQQAVPVSNVDDGQGTLSILYSNYVFYQN